MTQRQPAEAFPPSQFIQEEMDERQWTRMRLAQEMDESQTFVAELLTGQRGISSATAKKLAAAFGTSSVFWVNLEIAHIAYQLSRTRRSHDPKAAGTGKEVHRMQGQRKLSTD